MLALNPSARWVFIGDSITDCGRRQDTQAPRLGNGYVRLIHDYLLAKAPADLPHFYNEGISGNRIPHLAERWQRDVIAHNPHVVSIKIGVNDVWRQLDKKEEGTSLHDFVAIYERLIEETVTACPKVKFVLCEPSVISPPAPCKGNELLLPYAMAVHELRSKYHQHVCCVVGFHHMCLAVERSRPEYPWWPDGVHPSSAGHMLLARTWLQTTDLL